MTREREREGEREREREREKEREVQRKIPALLLTSKRDSHCTAIRRIVGAPKRRCIDNTVYV